jgi:hypothetical protein
MYISNVSCFDILEWLSDWQLLKKGFNSMELVMLLLSKKKDRPPD